MGRSRDEEQTKRANRRQIYLICALLIIATLAVYWQVVGFQFTNLDDLWYVPENPAVQAGLGADGLRYAFQPHEANWIPLVWLSFMADRDLSSAVLGADEADPGVCHVTNVILHIANVLLLFLLLNRLTGFKWRSAVVAALFAIHPLHVESVAWIAERKDVLSTLFWLLTMLAYVGYVRQPNLRRYGCVLLMFVLGLMSKQMLVTLPIVLLLMDYWPLRRVGEKSWRQLVIEKIPLFVLTVAACAITVVAQKEGSAITSFAKISLNVRPANAVVVCIAYLRKMFWPNDLACFYPHPGNHLPIWQVLVSWALLIGLSILAIRIAKRRPYATVGWFWYLITLVPVIGLVQVGDQAMADRYTYVPLIGIFMLIVWGSSEALAHVVGGKAILTALAMLSLIGLMIQAHAQVATWQNSVTASSHAAAVTERNSVAEYMLGSAYANDGKNAQAAKHVRIAIEYNPKYSLAHYTLGALMERQHRYEDATTEYRQAVRLSPGEAQAHRELGRILLRRGKLREALSEFEEAVRLDPHDHVARDNRDMIREEVGQD